MPPQIPSAGSSQSFNLLSILQRLPLAPSYRKNGVCASCSYTFSAKGPMTQRKQNKSRLKQHRNPYREAQVRQRKAANIARQNVLKDERAKAMGDPIRSIPTPFIKSLATGKMPGAPSNDQLKNFFLAPDELPQALEYSKKLSAPHILEPIEELNKEERGGRSAQAPDSQKSTAASAGQSRPGESATLPIERGHFSPSLSEKTKSSGRRASNADGPTPQQLVKLHGIDHINAARALSLITSLDNGSSSDLTRFNIQRCISTFGRQNTDAVLPPRPVSIYNTNSPVPKLRAGPDTGSSEVQVAILTVKINTLANTLHKNDKHSKRSLRLLVHKRQKLLAYLQRKERGGARWKNLVDGLGIQDAMWKGEITL